jgi:hypothetical protein
MACVDFQWTHLCWNARRALLSDATALCTLEWCGQTGARLTFVTCRIRLSSWITAVTSFTVFHRFVVFAVVCVLPWISHWRHVVSWQHMPPARYSPPNSRVPCGDLSNVRHEVCALQRTYLVRSCGPSVNLVEDILKAHYKCTLSAVNHRINVFSHLLIWTFSLILLYWTLAQSLSAPFSYTLYVWLACWSGIQFWTMRPPNGLYPRK